MLLKNTCGWYWKTLCIVKLSFKKTQHMIKLPLNYLAYIWNSLSSNYLTFYITGGLHLVDKRQRKMAFLHFHTAKKSRCLPLSSAKEGEIHLLLGDRMERILGYDFILWGFQENLSRSQIAPFLGLFDLEMPPRSWFYPFWHVNTQGDGTPGFLAPWGL